MSTDRKNRSGKEGVVARALVECAGRVLVVERNKYGEEYIVLPGGGVDPGEKPKDAVIRELAEETSVKAEVTKKVVSIPYNEEADLPETDIWLCSYTSGVPKLNPDSEEAAENKLGKNTYKPKWISVEEAIEKLVPMQARDYLRVNF